MSMKTAEVWANEIRYGHNHGGIDTVVRQIQLDAMKEGARRAASVVMMRYADIQTSAPKLKRDLNQAILATAENWTIKDL